MTAIISRGAAANQTNYGKQQELMQNLLCILFLLHYRTTKIADKNGKPWHRIKDTFTDVKLCCVPRTQILDRLIYMDKHKARTTAEQSISYFKNSLFRFTCKHLPSNFNIYQLLICTFNLMHCFTSLRPRCRSDVTALVVGCRLKALRRNQMLNSGSLNIQLGCSKQLPLYRIFSSSHNFLGIKQRRISFFTVVKTNNNNNLKNRITIFFILSTES